MYTWRLHSPHAGILFMTLTEYLKLYKLTQAGLAAKIGITQPYLSELLAGQRTPKLETLNRILAECGGEIRMEQLLEQFKPEIYRAIMQSGGKK